nr:MAG TPA_asm: hypothetical protein [Caudoviricetes sp.]
MSLFICDTSMTSITPPCLGTLSCCKTDSYGT